MAEWLVRSTADIVAFVLSAAMLGAYHVFLHVKVRKNPAYTVQAVNVIARTAWVESVMAGGKDILAVQTLRNSTMAATFLASTAVLLIIGVLNLSGQGAELDSAWHVLNVAGGRDPGIWLAKLLLMLLDLFVAFFSFSMSIRIYNHVGYMINVPLSAAQKAISPRHVAMHLNRGGRFYSVGMRAYYFLVPLVLWLFGPHFMLAATAALIGVLMLLDRAPKVLEQDYS